MTLVHTAAAAWTDARVSFRTAGIPPARGPAVAAAVGIGPAASPGIAEGVPPVVAPADTAVAAAAAAQRLVLEVWGENKD